MQTHLRAKQLADRDAHLRARVDGNGGNFMARGDGHSADKRPLACAYQNLAAPRPAENKSERARLETPQV
jgi:hypothetical protein